MTVVETPTAVARVEGAKEAFVTPSMGAEKRIVGQYDLLPGQVLRTGSKGRATLVYADGTRVTLEPGTKISGVKSLNGKFLQVDKGAVSAVVSKQKDGEPMVIGTSNATAKILGTTLRVAVESDLTRLQVLEGSVQLANKVGAFAAVTGGEEAKTRGSDKSIIPWSMSEERIREIFGIVISFGPPNRALPPGTRVDSGAIFDPKRGYGWDKDLGNGPLIGIADRLKASFVAGGTATLTGTWRMPLPNGKYVVRACVGGAPQGILDQGPHHVTVEGKVIIDTKMTCNGDFCFGEGEVDVIDGELRVVIGGHRSDLKTPTDKDDDTILNFITIRRVGN
jgi:hypothetical protein